MGHSAAEAAVRAGLPLVPTSFASPSDVARLGSIDVGGVSVSLSPPEALDEVLARAKAEHANLIVVDYTLPSAVNGNVEAYVRAGVPFVVGTTGGDRDALVEAAKRAQTASVISPNMGKQIVALQTAIARWAEEFPGSCAGYTLKVVESHQASKADASGTAKAIVASLRELGVRPFSDDDIELVRDRQSQIERMHVPEDAIGGHAFHTYTLTSPDGSVELAFQHNVTGRRVYAEGTVDAAIFLANKAYGNESDAPTPPGTVFSMIDVLRAGAMR